MQNSSLQMKRAMRTVLLVLLLSAAGMGKVYAQEFYEVCESGQVLRYKIIEDTNNEVMLFGGVDWGSDQPTGNLVIPSAVVNNGNTYQVTSIREGAFSNCSGLISVIIPNTVTSIGKNAFNSCSGMTSISIGNSIVSIETGTFSKCTGLTSITLPNSLIFIGEEAFSNCSGLTSITIPNSVTTIETKAFYQCTELTSITLGNSVTSIGYQAFHYTGWHMEQSTNQTDDLLYLGGWCLGPVSYWLEGEFAIADGTIGIANYAFSDWVGLTSITIPYSITSISNHAFFNCNSLTSVVIPNSVTSIGDGAFKDCRSLTSIVIPNSVTSIGPSAFLYSGLTSVTIPKSVSSIGLGAFSACNNLTTVYYNAEDAHIYYEVVPTQIYIFRDCNIKTLNIGADVRIIGPHIFENCTDTQFVQAFGSTPAILDEHAFGMHLTNWLLKVPCGKKADYQSAWNTWFNPNNIIEDCIPHQIAIGNVVGDGTITPSTPNAQMGEEVLLTILPNTGMALESITISNADDPSQTIPYYFPHKEASTIGFTMPPFTVEISATFKTSGASLNENAGITASVFPNPTSGIVTTEVEGIKHITITDLLGQIIYEGNANGNEFEYDFSKHEAGIYLIRIETERGVAMKKVLVER